MKDEKKNQTEVKIWGPRYIPSENQKVVNTPKENEHKTTESDMWVAPRFIPSHKNQKSVNKGKKKKDGLEIIVQKNNKDMVVQNHI